MISISSNNHRRQSLWGKFLYFGLLTIFIASCSPVETLQPTPIVVVVTATSPGITAVPSITSTSSTAAPNIPTCTILQDLNLRSGPGTAYNPPITALKAGTKFVPIGFNPQGVPGGAWVQARVDSINQTGWVSAGEQFVSCNLELATLPQVDVPPPPKGIPPKVGTGVVNGDNISAFRFSIDYNPDYFVHMAVFRSDDENEVFSADKDGRGIVSVEFVVTSPDGSSEFVEYYRKTESNPGYC